MQELPNATSRRDAETGFFLSSEPEPHVGRAKIILERHPDVRGLTGANPWTILLIISAVGFQLATAWLVRDLDWWWVLAMAYLVGAFATHALWVMIHECAHRLVFSGKIASRLAGLLANVPMVVPSSVSFERYHLRHHAYQGVYELDADLPSNWEIRFLGGTRLGRAFWLLIFPLVMSLRPHRIKSVALFDRWMVLNCVLVFGINILVAVYWGYGALLYLALSMTFSIGLHPLGARWVQEHYTGDPQQETYSYYGWLNKLQLNVGYHNEHHDFPSVPWNRLPKIRQIAPEMYDSLDAHLSWTRLALRFILTDGLTLHSRIVRTGRNPLSPPKSVTSAR